MIYLEQTKNKVGILLTGNNADLVSLYDSFSGILEISNITEDSKNFGYQFLYELRKGYEGKRLLLDNNLYGINLLWISFLLQLQFLRSLCAYIPTTKKIQSDLYRIEYLIEELIKSIDVKVYTTLEKKWFNNPIYLPDNYLFEYVNYLDYMFFKENKLKFKNLPKFLYQYSFLSEEYKIFEKNFKSISKKNNANIDNSYNEYVYPPDEKW